MQAIWKLRFNILRGTVVHISALWLSQYYDDEENKKKVILVVFIVLETIFKIMGKRK